MSASQPKMPQMPRRWPASARTAVVSALAVALAVSIVAMASGSSGALFVNSASNSTLGERILVNAEGHTLYVLSPETTHHLLCKSEECLKFWPPLTVSSRKTKLKAGSGVHGSLGILKRANGTFQVTIRGLPLYRYAGDHSSGQANGQGIHSFGGVWQAVSASASADSAPPATSTAPGGYGEPATSSTSSPPASTTTSTTPASTPTAPVYPKEEPKKEESW